MNSQDTITTLDNDGNYSLLLLSTRSSPTDESIDEDQRQSQPPGATLVELDEMESPTITPIPVQKDTMRSLSDSHSLYCGPCNRKFSRKDNYRQHRRTVHKKKLMSFTRINLPVVVLPDENDPNFYCRACNKTYSRWFTYRSHLQKAHEMALVPVPSPSKIFLLPNQKYDDRFSRCQTCGRYFSSKCGYIQHLRKAHQITLPVPNPHLTPDEDDPDLYCKACKIHSISRSAFDYHLRRTHKMTLTRRTYTYHTY
ncbi:hypothetical protein BDF21DRAFT_415168 [Thamnidium elegans]|nr:hypothetical protein BDF21DRAFT_415168 [Thamnidium elegans]